MNKSPPDFSQAGDGRAPRSLSVDPGPHPADETLSALGGSLDGRVDEISGILDNASRAWGIFRGLGPPLLFPHLKFVLEAFGAADLLVKK